MGPEGSQWHLESEGSQQPRASSLDLSSFQGEPLSVQLGTLNGSFLFRAFSFLFFSLNS